jgi:cell division septation protein DedD
MVSGAKERIAFASAAIDLIHATSNGVPRLVNIICDRALSRAHQERLSVIGPPLVGGAIDELKLTSGRVVVSGHLIERAPAVLAAPDVPAVPVAPAVAAATVVPDPPAAVPVAPAPVAAASAAAPASNRAGLFERRAVPVPESSRATSELHALLDLAPTTPKVAAPGMREPARDWPSDQAKVGPSAAPAWSWRMESEVRRETRSIWLKNVGLAVLGMGVLLLAGGIAVTAQRGKPGSESIAPAPQTTVAPSAAVVPAAVQEAPPVDAAAITTPAPQDTWIVQVGAFSSQERSLGIVQRLRQAGFPAFEVPTPDGSHGLLYFVRVGPFKTAGEADDVRARLREFSDIDDAFVRSVSPPAP